MKYVAITLLLISSLCLRADISVKLLLAIEKVESEAKPYKIGDDGLAYGCMQIHYETVLDVNRVYGLNFKHRDAFNRGRAFKICILYLKYWGKIYKKRTGNEPTDMVYARIWNGGPNGWKLKKTLEYWSKVKERMENVN